MSGPAEIIEQLAKQATRLTSPCGEGQMVWHRWDNLHGSQPPLVLLHGGFGSWTHWARAIPLLSKHYDVITADLPGLGDSSDAPEPHTPGGLAAIVSAGLDHILPADHPFHLAGFSFGGMLGSIVAATQQQRCRTFTAVGASGFGDLHYIVEGIRLPDPDMNEAEIVELHRSNLKLLMFANARSSDDLAVFIHRNNVSRARIRSRRLSVSDALVRALPQISARIGGIWGELDVTGGGVDKISARAEMFRDLQPDAPFDVINGAGHWVMYEAENRFSEALLHQLDRRKSVS